MAGQDNPSNSNKAKQLDDSQFDPKKAELFNKAQQAGLSIRDSYKAAGIKGFEASNYGIGEDGKLGSSGVKVAGVDYDKWTPAEIAESDKYYASLESHWDDEPPYVSKEKPPVPFTTTVISTETVSGGGSTTITLPPKVPNDASRAVQASIDANKAEVTQFVKDNPDNWERQQAGLPLLSEEENQKLEQKVKDLYKERADLEQKKFSLEGGDGPATVTVVPNTTTTTQTVKIETSAVNTPVDALGGADAAVSRQTAAQLGVSPAASGGITKSAAEVSVEKGIASGEELVESENATTTDDPFETARLAAKERSAVEAQLPEDLPTEQDPFEARRLELEQQSNRNELAQQEDAAVDADIAAQRAAHNRGDVEDFPPTPAPDPVDAKIAALRAAHNRGDVEDFPPTPAPDTAPGKTQDAKQQPTIASQRKTVNDGDWRVRLRLAPKAEYLYQAKDPGILKPLAQSDGVIFPYTPVISTGYRANYGTSDLTHSNYRGHFYQNSYVDAVTLRCPFTAQSTAEADYLLAVIHFFRSATKMFYGQDTQRGAPPPLVYLSGLGQYQFSEHPCVVSSFDYTLPGDVDYIRAGSGNNNQTNVQNLRTRSTGASSNVSALGGLLGGALDRLAAAGATKGAVNITPPAATSAVKSSRDSATYVPTKMEISLTLLPMQSRAQISQEFSVKGFANGDLLKGGFW